MENKNDINPLYSIFILPFPPSINHYWTIIPMGRKVRMIIGKRGKDFRQQIQKTIGKIQCNFNKLSVKIMVCPPDKRRRDLDNLLKATLDALQHAGVYKDDCQIDDLHICRSSKIISGGKLIIYIKEIL